MQNGSKIKLDSTAYNLQILTKIFKHHYFLYINTTTSNLRFFIIMLSSKEVVEHCSICPALAFFFLYLESFLRRPFDSQPENLTASLIVFFLHNDTLDLLLTKLFYDRPLINLLLLNSTILPALLI